MSSEFWCPNCLRRFPKDQSIEMLTSGAMIVGDGFRYSGDLEKEIHKIKRLKYCRVCHGPIDFHALLRGQLDYGASGPVGGFGGAIVGFIAGYILFTSFWLGAITAVVAAIGCAIFFDRLEVRKIKQRRVSEEVLQEFERERGGHS